MDFTPHTPDDVRAMLEALGMQDLRELFADLPDALLEPDLRLPAPMSEQEILAHLRELAAKNTPADKAFLGGGLRPHFVPSLVPALAQRGEFLTAYTPYQPEVSQGVLQAVFEYQTMIAELTGLDVSNASLYDGAAALAEGVLLALRQTRRMGVVVSQGVHPEYRQVLATYLHAVGAELRTVALEGGLTPPAEFDDSVGAVVLQSPNFLGAIEDPAPWVEAAHARGALVVYVADPLSLALLKPPGEWGADIAVGDGQPLGNPMNFGGPQFGYIAVREKLVRQLPGRLVSQTHDSGGRRGYVLALAAREQHIRRAKAKSNITTNAQLTALMGAMHLAALGPEGFAEVAAASVARAHALAEMLARLPGVERVTPEPFFNEFALRLPRPAPEVRAGLAERGWHAAAPVPAEYGANLALFAATERHEEDDLAGLAAALKEVFA
ncbi:glycine dehydrogenase (decarboxylating) alpha subunit [Oceanithermus profundus DSM 14977]|uniref:Probable glycine dehydrogenase (decarboxylating) subunit 1 n=1 Tax=Oceanithermus profundus (strain DSM 14977 / NBRC 100410 / VKM B-2274 / 506) TaxID=670487 RepID=E4U9J8_OCEP5|nr:aminomethyl-transferring glycine dehydrogenase subunit GcvPA [Oceanithermus profundus]ADR37094.1 glycine dehydrogenase (decarboxylating) alpha subunit [Oceanithermus profundus DSM 14977]